MAAFANGALAQPLPALSDEQVRHQIIQESIWAYAASGRPCGCPFHLMPNGSRCGLRSAYNQRDVPHPLCSRADITERMVRAWKRIHDVR